MADDIKKYTRLVNIAYSFYIGVCVLWAIMTMTFGHTFNYQALLAAAIFSTQLYFKNRLAHLLLGVLLFFISIYSLLEFLAMGGVSGFNGFVYTMSGFSAVSIIMAGILVFSYLKLSFANK